MVPVDTPLTQKTSKWVVFPWLFAYGRQREEVVIGFGLVDVGLGILVLCEKVFTPFRIVKPRAQESKIFLQRSVQFGDLRGCCWCLGQTVHTRRGYNWGITLEEKLIYFINQRLKSFAECLLYSLIFFLISSSNSFCFASSDPR